MKVRDLMEKEAVDARIVGALAGSGVGTLWPTEKDEDGQENKKDKLRNALIGGLLGGTAGAGVRALSNINKTLQGTAALDSFYHNLQVHDESLDDILNRSRQLFGRN
jgi:hypothetical protein